MYFKTMEIQGFKSFADKTVLNFDRKMTAIVGSNGNGKSNISDALRWVMGEQGAKTLRGDKMEDVIFHGTVTRRPMGFAKVSLSIDNSDRALPVDSDEVIIARKLYRTGESEYLINDQKSRLKDIQELLMGTGLGRDGYSVIGQGRVAEIVNSRVNQRRELFEEAAGVSKFLHRKQEAERDLARAEENITRLNDIESELHTRLPVLERQSEKARAARVIMEREKGLDIGIGVWDLKRIDGEISLANDKILENQGQCEHFEREISQLERESETNADSKMAVTAKQEELRKRDAHAREEISEQEKSRAVLENERQHCFESIENLKKRIAESEQSGEELDKRIAAYAEEISKKEKELAENAEKQAGLNSRLSQTSGYEDELGKQYKDLDERQGKLVSERTELKLKAEQEKRLAEDVSSRLESEKERNRSREESLKALSEKKRNLKEELEKICEQKDETNNKLNGFSKLLESKREKLDEKQAAFDQNRREYERAKSRLDVLSDVEKNMTGYISSVKTIVNASRHGRISGITGTVADIIKVDKRHTVAIETALGASLQNVIVDNEETAKRCIRYLKENSAGRATFLPLTSIRGNTLSVNGLSEEYGYEGVASELVKCDEKYLNIVRFVLGRCVIAEDIDTAAVIAKKYGYKFKIVTLDGQIINSGGSFTGGSVREAAGIISRNQEIADLKVIVGKASEKMKLSEGELAALKEETAKMSIETEGFKDRLSVFQREEARLTSELSGAEDMRKQLEEQLESEEAYELSAKKEIERCLKAAEDCEKKLSELETRLAELQKVIGETDEALQARLDEKNKIAEQITAIGLKSLALEKDIQHTRELKENDERTKLRLGEDNSELKNQIEEQRLKADDLRKQAEEKGKLAEQMREKLKNSGDESAKFLEQMDALERRTAEISREIREKSADKEKFSNALAVAQEKRSALEKESERIKSSFWEKYELTPSEAGEAAEIPEDINAARAEYAELKRKISALGNVNFAAVEEFEELSARYAELKKQLDDVLNSKRELEKLISDLTEDIKTKFLYSFNEINKHFGRIFTEVFGGGSAHLELTEPDDVLNSGIEIYAAPPGKLIKNLMALSGGEQTMVAITIYFAILQHRPTPFCMLDEVDAALDEVNVIKYITYLKRFSGETQLMVITHRRGTIEGCDVLYGVYMQEKGVSRLLRQEIIDDNELS